MCAQLPSLQKNTSFRLRVEEPGLWDVQQSIITAAQTLFQASASFNLCNCLLTGIENLRKVKAQRETLKGFLGTDVALREQQFR